MKSIFVSQVRISFQLIIPSQGIAVTFSPEFARGVGTAGLLLAILLLVAQGGPWC